MPKLNGNWDSIKTTVMRKPRPDWQVYERLVARLLVEDLPTDLCVTPNARVMGLVSRTPRQVDVLIDSRHDTDNSRRIIVDAKKRQRRIDVPQVEAFESFMKDVGATHGFLVSPAGHSKAAERRAQDAITIWIVPLEHIEAIDPSAWPRCQGAKCRSGRVFWDGFPEVYATVQRIEDPSSTVTPAKRLSFIHYTGKCDGCGRFHVRCLTCNDTMSFDDEDGEHRCRCRMPWFWLASIEQDEQGVLSAELHLVMGMGKVETVNRRPVLRRHG